MRDVATAEAERDTRAGQGHVGLALLEDLVEQSGGTLVAHSAPGHGTTVTVLVHDGHMAWRGHRHGPVTFTLQLRDYTGADHVTVRVTSPGGNGCPKSDLISD